MQPKPAHKFTVPGGVSALALNATDEKLVIASGSVAYVWDVTSQQFVTPSHLPDANHLRLHYKLVTAVSVVNHIIPDEGEVIISASLDKLAKVTSLRDLRELHQFQYTFPITAIGATVSLKSYAKYVCNRQHICSEMLSRLKKKKPQRNYIFVLRDKLVSFFSGYHARFIIKLSQLAHDLQCDVQICFQILIQLSCMEYIIVPLYYSLQ